MGKLASLEELFVGRALRPRSRGFVRALVPAELKLSLRDIGGDDGGARLRSPGHTADHALRVLRYAPEMEKRWRRFARAVVGRGESTRHT